MKFIVLLAIGGFASAFNLVSSDFDESPGIPVEESRQKSLSPAPQEVLDS